MYFDKIQKLDQEEQDKIKNNLKIIQFPNQKNNPIFLEEQGELMPGIKKRKDGRYEVRKMEKGKRISIYAHSEKEALKLFNKLKNNKIKIENKKTELTTYTLTEWILQWEETYKKPFVKQKTLKDIHNSLKSVFINLGDININKITTLTIQQFLNKQRQNRVKEKMQTYLNAILQKAYDLDIISKNPFSAVEKAKKGKYKNNTFTFAEQEKIINAINGSIIEHEIYTYLLTGARPSELPNKENFDFKNHIVVINGTKTEKSKHREVQLSKEFSLYIENFFKYKKFKPYTTIQTEFKNICSKLKIEKPLIYRLRHTFATNHFVLGTTAKQVSEWMGHSSITITLDTYTDIDKTSSAIKIKKLYNNFYYTSKNSCPQI